MEWAANDTAQISMRSVQSPLASSPRETEQEITILMKSLASGEADLASGIRQLQKIIWENIPGKSNNKINERLYDLAYDLDFYAADISARERDGNYLDDDRAREEIRAALADLNF